MTERGWYRLAVLKAGWLAFVAGILIPRGGVWGVGFAAGSVLGVFLLDLACRELCGKRS